MSGITAGGGGYRFCPTCGKRFYVTDCDVWAFQRNTDKGKKHFCTWGCVRKWDKEHEEDVIKRRQEIAHSYHVRKGHSKAQLEGKTCADCRYYDQAKYGFADCSARGWAVSKCKMACNKFKPRYEEEVCTKN